jgi:phage-related protein (TIGR01555 family)
VFKGKEIPSMYRAIGRGWGLSILESFVRTLNKNIKNENVIYELLDEAKMDIYKLNELNDSMLEEDSTDAVKRRLSYAQMIKNYMKALVLDTTDEYAQKQIHFSGLAELKEDARIDMAADTRIQITKLFGMTPAGFNSGDADRATYNDMVEAEVRFPCEPNMIRILEIVGRKVLGKTLDWDFEWPELERMSKYDEAKMKTLELANLNEANIWGRISNYEWTQGINDKNLLNMTVSYKPEFIPDPLAKQVFKPGFGGGGK